MKPPMVTWPMVTSKNADLSGVGTLTSSTGRTDVLWNAAFPNINTANGVIENGIAVGISASLLAEAYFFRAIGLLFVSSNIRWRTFGFGCR